MENPSSWNLLTASLNIANAERDPALAWSFLALQGLVKTGTDSYAAFLSQAKALRTERQNRGPMPGPSFGADLAPRLASLVLLAGRQPDPLGKIAHQRWDAATAWRKASAR